MAAVWVGTVKLDPALEHEFQARVQDSFRLAFRVALSVLKHREDAEDVAQDAFIRAHRSFNSIRNRDRFRAWLVRTVFRLALDRVRRQKRRTRYEDFAGQETPLETACMESEAMQVEVRARVSAAVAELPEKLRLVMVLVGIEGQDLAAVGRLLEIPEGTVKSRLHGARKVLAEKLRCFVQDTATR